MYYFFIDNHETPILIGFMIKYSFVKTIANKFVSSKLTILLNSQILMSKNINDTTVHILKSKARKIKLDFIWNSTRSDIIIAKIDN